MPKKGFYFNVKNVLILQAPGFTSGVTRDSGG